MNISLCTNSFSIRLILFLIFKKSDFLIGVFFRCIRCDINYWSFKSGSLQEPIDSGRGHEQLPGRTSRSLLVQSQLRLRTGEAAYQSYTHSQLAEQRQGFHHRLRSFSQVGLLSAMESYILGYYMG